MEVMAYLRIIGRYWWVILLTTLVSGGVALGITSMRSKIYTVHVRVLAQPGAVVSDTRTLVDDAGQIGTREIMGTLAQVFTSAEVRDNALRATGMSQAEALNYSIEANPLPDSSVIDVLATGHDPVILTNYVNATVDAAVKYGSTIYRVIDLVPLDRAAVPTMPTSPVPARDIPLGAGLGLLLGILLAFTVDYMRTPRAKETGVQIRALPTNPASLARDERIAVSGGQRQEYLGAKQYPGGALPPGRQDGGNYPG